MADAIICSSAGSPRAFGADPARLISARLWRALSILLLSAVAATGLACEGEEASESETAADGEEAELDTEGEAVTPPFEVKGDCDGLLLVWFDDEGPHSATSRDEIPEAHRERVRVDSLSLAPEDRLDPAFVYVADLRAPGEAGRYPVRKLPREAFESLIDRAAPSEPAATASADVIIYGADWCGACRSTAAFLRERNVPFVEKNVERDPQAQAEMQQKCRRAGISPNGIPVIDFRGTILTGFDPARLASLIAQTAPGTPI